MILSCCNMSFPHSFMASPTHTPITIKKPHNYYSQSCPLLGSVCEFNFFLSLYIWELHSLQHPASLFMFLSVFHSHSWNRRINLGSDVPFFSFKKISLLLQRTWIWKESAGAIAFISCTHENERVEVSLKQFSIYIWSSLQNKIYMAAMTKVVQAAKYHLTVILWLTTNVCGADVFHFA